MLQKLKSSFELFHILLLLVPVALVGGLALHWNPLLVFLLAAVAVVPLAGLIGKSTEMLSERTGPKVGGLLNATLGNAAELIITIVAIQKGLLELVKASITGSIIGNLLVVLGFSLLLGGLRHGVQQFDRRQASQNANMLLMALIALAIPSLYSSAIGPEGSAGVEALSLGVAALMMMIYVLGVIYSFRAKESPLTRPSTEHAHPEALWSVSTAVIVLALATLGVVVMSEVLVGAVEQVVEHYRFITEFFLGIVLIPIVGNIAEHVVGIQVALKDEMDLSIEISVGSSLQIAMFVAPALVFISLILGNPLTLVFNQFELIAVSAASIISAFVSIDGRSNWLEGAQLLAVYVMLCLAFFFLPG